MEITGTFESTNLRFSDNISNVLYDTNNVKCLVLLKRKQLSTADWFDVKTDNLERQVFVNIAGLWSYSDFKYCLVKDHNQPAQYATLYNYYFALFL